jgi:hypothetical protein
MCPQPCCHTPLKSIISCHFLPCFRLQTSCNHPLQHLSNPIVGITLGNNYYYGDDMLEHHVKELNMATPLFSTVRLDAWIGRSGRGGLFDIVGDVTDLSESGIECIIDGFDGVYLIGLAQDSFLPFHISFLLSFHLLLFRSVSRALANNYYHCAKSHIMHPINNLGITCLPGNDYETAEAAQFCWINLFPGIQIISSEKEKLKRH